MPQTFRRVTSGAPLDISSRAWNAALAAAEASQRSQRTLSSPSVSLRGSDVVAVEGVTRTDQIPAGSVVAIGDAVRQIDVAVDPDDRPASTAALIDLPDGSGLSARFGVAARNIEIDRAGPVVLAGMVWARVDLRDADHGHARPVMDGAKSGVMVSDVAGPCRIAWPRGDTGERWTLVEVRGRSFEPVPAVVSAASGTTPALIETVTYSVQPLSDAMEELTGVGTGSGTPAAGDVRIQRPGWPDAGLLLTPAPMGSPCWIQPYPVGTGAGAGVALVVTGLAEVADSEECGSGGGA